MVIPEDAPRLLAIPKAHQFPRVIGETWFGSARSPSLEIPKGLAWPAPMVIPEDAPRLLAIPRVHQLPGVIGKTGVGSPRSPSLEMPKGVARPAPMAVPEDAPRLLVTPKTHKEARTPGRQTGWRYHWSQEVELMGDSPPGNLTRDCCRQAAAYVLPAAPVRTPPAAEAYR
jgi:hypothetical protein